MLKNWLVDQIIFFRKERKEREKGKKIPPFSNKMVKRVHVSFSDFSIFYIFGMFPRHSVYQNVWPSRRSPTRACRTLRPLSRRAQTLVPFPVHKSLPTSLRKKFRSTRSPNLSIDRIRLAVVAVVASFHGFRNFATSHSSDINFWRSSRFSNFSHFFRIKNKIHTACLCAEGEV